VTGQLLAAVALAALAAAPLADAAAQSRAPDPINEPTIDFQAPAKKRVSTALPDPMPPIPPASALRSFQVSAATQNSFGIDPQSLLVRDRRTIQYTLVITSPRGVRNIGYEAIDCEQGKVALLATGRDGAGWTPVSAPNWRPVARGDTVNTHHRELAGSWCQGGGAAGEPDELLRRLTAVPEHYLY
jgi:hypothetical protein